MVILIGGESHTGKTRLAQRLLETHHIPYTSIDHIKMGMIRGFPVCGFTATDPDDVIAGKLWGVVKGIVDTCLENKQNIIIEGCYLLPDQVARYDNCKSVIPVYLIFSGAYIKNHFTEFIGYENVIEHRRYPEERTIREFIYSNQTLKKACKEAGAPFFEIKSDYEGEMGVVITYIEEKIREAQG